MSKIWEFRGTRVDLDTLVRIEINWTAGRPGDDDVSFDIDIYHFGEPSMGRARVLNSVAASRLRNWMMRNATDFTVSWDGGAQTWLRNEPVPSKTQEEALAEALLPLCTTDLARDSVRGVARSLLHALNSGPFYAAPLAEPHQEHAALQASEKLVDAKVAEHHAAKPMTATNNGKLPVENEPRDGQRPIGYLVGHLSPDALECLRDVVSHATDFEHALVHRRDTALNDGAKSYWDKQIVVFARMVEQAKSALDIHAKVSP